MKVFPAGSPQLEPPSKARKKVDITERKVEGIYLYDIRAKSPSRAEQKQPTKRLYYFAGGGWQAPASSQHWSLVTELALRLPNILITLVSYPLAPNTPAPVAFPLLTTLYDTLLLEAQTANEEVILMGDSAGGNIVLSLVVNSLLTNPSARCPKAIIAISPSTDLRRSNPEMKEIEKNDPLLRMPFVVASANAWRGAWDASDARVSPLLADLTPLARRDVQVHGVTGTYDILSPDAALFREACSSKGVRGEWLQWERQTHCFPLMFAYGLREAREAVDWMVDLLGRC
jgi:acetyl esterase/lipase